MKKVASINKMRNMVAWADYQHEGFNQLFKSISQLEKAYDFCQKNGYEFLDFEYMEGLEAEDEEKCIDFLKAIKII
jgi:hypothetical protein